MTMHFTGMIISSIARLINGDAPHDGFEGAFADEHQQNGMYGAHQLRVTLSDDPTVYRVIVAPANAPITIGGIPADQHFLHVIGELPR
jgi:hypothetical protein